MKEKRKKLLVSSCCLWKDTKRVGLHYLTDFFLKKNYDVFWLTIPFSLLFFIKPTYFHKKVNRLKLVLSKGKEYKIGNNRVINGMVLSVFHPIKAVPFLNSSFVGRNYLNLSYPSLNRLLKKYDFKNPDIFMFDTGGLNGNILQFIKPKFTIYRLNDSLPGFYSNIQREARGRLKFENEFFRKSGIILGASKSLCDYAIQKRESSKDIYLLPNGVDIGRFLDQTTEPAEYKNIPKPRAIYVGAIANRFDWNLVKSVAQKNKNISFIIIGSEKILSNIPKNIFILGEISYQRIPSYLQYSEVGLIPFKNVPRMQEVERPLKFYEYLAAGLPIVSVSYGNLEEGMSPYALFGNTPEEFSSAIRRALSYTKGDRKKLRQKAKQFSWEKIYEKFEKILKENKINL